MEGMGFSDRPRNIRALQRTMGNVEAAVNLMMDGSV
jgi:hypothetical protein